MIPQSVWKVRKKELLQRAGLEGFESFQELEPELKKALKAQYRTTNKNIDSGKNPYAKVDDKGKLKVSTPKVEKDVSYTVTDLFPKNRFISLFEVLTTVNRLSNFSDCFEHWQIKHNREKPEEKTFFAGVMGYGCNLGIRKIARISRNINQNELENTVNWYFTNENLIQANDRILKLSERLQLLSLFKKESAKTGSTPFFWRFLARNGYCLNILDLPSIF
ncbi:Tn3 family transposase [Desulfobacula toluolica]|uniref:Tn3 family transposase n=1 Tax=Desulfobacula toluolica TaxID=28223 RepID=UPI001E3E0224|nr:Tn3 family transposase [Desulfobacula toluolica]